MNKRKTTIFSNIQWFSHQQQIQKNKVIEILQIKEEKKIWTILVTPSAGTYLYNAWCGIKQPGHFVLAALFPTMHCIGITYISQPSDRPSLFAGQYSILVGRLLWA